MKKMVNTIYTSKKKLQSGLKAALIFGAFFILFSLVDLHLLVDGDGVHDMPKQGPRPGEVPEIAHGLPDEAVAEELLVVVDEPIVGGDGGLVVLVAGVDGANLANQVLHPARLHQSGLFGLYLGIENAGEEVVLVGRKVAGVLIDARVVGAESQDFAVLGLVPVDDVGHLEHGMRESAVNQGDEVPVCGDCEKGENTHYQPALHAKFGGVKPGDAQGKEGEEREKIVELNRQGGEGEHKNAVGAEDEPLHLFADLEEEDGNHQDCPNAELDQLEPPERRLAIRADAVIVEDVDHEIRLPKCRQSAMSGEVDQHPCRDCGNAQESPPDDHPEVPRLPVPPSDIQEHEKASSIEEKEVELHPKQERDADAHHERRPSRGHLPVPDEAQHVVEAVSEDGEGELLDAVAVAEEVGSVGQKPEKKREGEHPRGRREEPHRPPRIEQIEEAAHDLHQINADETAPRKHGRPFVQEEQHRPLVVKDVDIEFLAAKHGVSYRHIDIGVVPRIERIKERASAEYRYEKCGKKEQKKLFHGTHS